MSDTYLLPDDLSKLNDKQLQATLSKFTSVPQLQTALSKLTVAQLQTTLNKLTVVQLQAVLKTEKDNAKLPTLKPQLVETLAGRIRPAAGKNTDKGSKGENTAAEVSKGENPEKTDAAGSKGENTAAEVSKGENPEKTDAAGSNGGNAEKTDAAESNGDKTDGTSKKGAVRTLAPVASGTGDDNIDDEFEQALAKLKQMQISGDSEDSTKKKLDEAKKKFVELSKSGASTEELNKSLEAIEKLKSLSKPKKYDQKGYVIYNSPSNPAILLNHVIWTDVDMKRAMISCGPPKAAIWRVVPLAEARAYEGFAEADGWFADRLKFQDTSPEKPTPAEARQIIGVGFARPIVVNLSMDKVFEKRSPKSREDKVKSLPANAAKDIKEIVANKHRRHVHVIISYERNGVWFQKHAPFTHWIKVAGLKEPAGLDLVKSAAADEQTRWEAWLEEEHPDSYKQLEESGLEFESEDEKMLQDSRDNTPDSRESTPGTAQDNGTKAKKSDKLQDSRDNTPDSRESTPGIDTPKSRGSTPGDAHDDDTKTKNSDKGTHSADIPKPSTESPDS